MMLDIGRRYGMDLHGVPMVADTLRDLLAARAAGCPPHLVLSGRAADLDEDGLRQILQQVPETTVHRDLAAFADHLIGSPRGASAAGATAQEPS
jgi:D-glycero-D-manno-heptose 1,7-bisphosphate phosphatase